MNSRTAAAYWTSRNHIFSLNKNLCKNRSAQGMEQDTVLVTELTRTQQYGEKNYRVLLARNDEVFLGTSSQEKIDHNPLNQCKCALFIYKNSTLQ